MKDAFQSLQFCYNPSRVAARHGTFPRTSTPAEPSPALSNPRHGVPYRSDHRGARPVRQVFCRRTRRSNRHIPSRVHSDIADPSDHGTCQRSNHAHTDDGSGGTQHATTSHHRCPNPGGLQRACHHNGSGHLAAIDRSTHDCCSSDNGSGSTNFTERIGHRKLLRRPSRWLCSQDVAFWHGRAYRRIERSDRDVCGRRSWAIWRGPNPRSRRIDLYATRTAVVRSGQRHRNLVTPIGVTR